MNLAPATEKRVASNSPLAPIKPIKRYLTVLLIVVGAFCLAAGGCAPTFEARPVKAGAAVGTTGSLADQSRDWPPAFCVQILSETSAGPAQDGRRRLATSRLLELYAPTLLAAPDHALRLPEDGAGRRSVLLRLRRGAGPGGIEPARFETLEPADRFAVTGVQRFNRAPGVGAPLVGTLQPILPVGRPEPVPPRPVPGLVWAVTAVPVVSPASGSGSTRTVTLELFDPHTTDHAGGKRNANRPLAGDFTTPLAVASTRFRPKRNGLFGFLRADGDYFPSAGLFPTQLPTPDKTPVVLVHGLISDPGDFRDLRNALTTDPEVRRRYQVWVFYYPTSLPVPYSAMMLREDLQKLTRQLDPAGTHPAMHRVVLVGHSMGGLLSRLTISDGGDVYFHHFFRQPIGELKLTPGERELVRRGFYYRANPDVAKVVFIATPHRGSKLAGGLLGNLGRLLVRVPLAVRERVFPIVLNNRAALVRGAPLKLGSSVDSLSPRDPVIAALNDLPMHPGVRLFSILGDRGRSGPREQSSDGVVPYSSSHLDGVESERMVPAGHTGTLSRPETGDELNRILTK